MAFLAEGRYRIQTARTAVATVLFVVSLAAQKADEPPPVFKASALLTPSVAKGAHYTVDEPVRTEGYFHEFTLSSPFDSFEAVGRSELTVRIQEINALAALQEVSKTEVFLAAAGQSVVNIGKSAAGVVTDPVETAKGLGAGIKRFGVNLGRRTQRAVESTDDSDAAAKGETKDKDSEAEKAAKGVAGVTAASRRWAQKVGVDPYTTNVVLRQALSDIGKVDAAGSIATKVVVPIPGVVGLTSTVGGLVWSKDPEEVRKINEQRLRELKVQDDVAKALFKNPSFTLTYQTRLIAALRAVNASGCADYVQTAAEARNEREALFFVESAEMLQQWHSRQPVVAVLTDSRAMVAASRGGHARALLPLDWVRWTAATGSALNEIGTRARTELKATHLQVALTGRASDRAAGEMKSRGWEVVLPGQ